jgi:hypothetical protein
MMTIARPSPCSQILRIPNLLILSSGHPANRTPHFQLSTHAERDVLANVRFARSFEHRWTRTLDGVEQLRRIIKIDFLS